MIYLDYNATAPLKPAVKAAMLEVMDITGNASSVHASGRRARALLSAARDQVAALVGVKPAQVIFTGGGTEANNAAMRGLKVTRRLTSAVEHPSVLVLADATIPVDDDGLIDAFALEHLLQQTERPALVSVMLVNNETGVIQPVAEIAALVHHYGGLIHVDAVQAIGKIPVDFSALGVDLLSISAHKFGGPQGVGALIVKDHLPLQPLLVGGGQEMRRRAGTENILAVTGFGVAAQLVGRDLALAKEWAAWRDAFEATVTQIAPDAVIVGAAAPRAPHVSCVVMPTRKSETQLMALDLAGIAVSAGSACSSGKVTASHVLRAMGFHDADAAAALRFSCGWATQPTDWETAAESWCTLYKRTQRRAA